MLYEVYQAEGGIVVKGIFKEDQIIKLDAMAKVTEEHLSILYNASLS